MLYRLAPWPENHAIRRLEHYDEALRGDPRRGAARPGPRRRQAAPGSDLLAPLAGLLPGEIQKKMERDFGAPALADDDRLGRAALSRRLSRPRRISHRQRRRRAGHARLDHAFPPDRPVSLRRVRPAPRERDRGTGADGLAARRPRGDRLARRAAGREPAVAPAEPDGPRRRTDEQSPQIASTFSSPCSPCSTSPSRNSSRAASASTRCTGAGSPPPSCSPRRVAQHVVSLSAFGTGDGIGWTILWLLPVGYLAVEQIRRLAALARGEPAGSILGRVVRPLARPLLAAPPPVDPEALVP